MIIKKIIKKIFYILLNVLFIFLLFLKKFFNIKIFLIDYSAIGAYTQFDFNLIINKLNNKKSINFVFSSTNWGMVNYDWLNLWNNDYIIIKKYSLLNLFLNDFSKKNLYKSLFHQPIKFNKIYNNTQLLNEFIHDLNNQNTKNVSFTNEQINLGNKLLKKYDLAKYICIHSRDNLFRKNLNVKKNWDYHNYRDSNINNYIEGTLRLSEMGYKIVRMGYKVKDIDKKYFYNKNLINYSKSNLRSNFNDIYLSANCNFYVVSDTGASSFPEAFRKPIVYVNWTEIKGIYNTATIPGGLIIFKKYFSRKFNRYLNLSEIVQLDISKGYQQMLTKQEIDLIENSPDEIYNACIEMKERLSKTWKEGEKHKSDQYKIWQILKLGKIYNNKFIISRYFLQKNNFFLN